jgi:hypothetical protein
VTPISLGIFASANNTVATSFESIATVTVGSGGAANVEFTSIPGTYTHLQLRMIGRTEFASGVLDNIFMQFNSDTGTTYDLHNLNGNGASAAAGASTSRANVIPLRSTSNGAGANTFGAAVCDILDYTNTNKYTTIRSLTGYDNNGSGEIFLLSGLWRSTSAITSIKIFQGVDDIAQYSHFALYGIKSA